MSTPIDNGGPAFPSEIDSEHYMQPTTRHESGMSLRDWFAGRALCALLSQIETHVALTEKRFTQTELALSSYAWADAMIEARKPRP